MPSTLSPVEIYRRISGGEAADLIDVRSPGEFARQHAAGARSLPLDQLDPAAFLRERESANGRPIYLICQSGKRAAMAADKLVAAGCTNAVIVDGGTVAWEEAGLPCESTGRGVISLERQVRIATGVLVLTGIILAWSVNPQFIWLSAFVGAGLIFAGITDFCGMGLLLAKMPWNR
jgi:rhodanese-related sulfurtransferase